MLSLPAASMRQTADQSGCDAAAKGDMEFVMSMSTSNIVPTFQIDPEQQLRIKARYNATVRHTGEHCCPWPGAACILTPAALLSEDQQKKT